MLRFSSCKARGLAGAAGALAVTAGAHADFIGLYVESTATSTLTNTTLVGTTYRIYAQFDDPSDRFLSALDGSLFFQGDGPYQHDSPDGFDTDLGPHNPVLDGFEENLAADSWVGVNDGTPNADGSWDAGLFASGIAIVGGWFVNPPTNPANGLDENNRVLVMHLTFLGENHRDLNGMITTDFGSNVFGTVAFANEMFGSIRFSYNPQGVAGGITGVTVFFAPAAPGSLGLLGLAGMLGKRRRRSRGYGACKNAS